MWVQPIFKQEIRNRCGAGGNLILEMQLNNQLKYKKFFRIGPQAFEELLSLVGPVIKKVNRGREPINPATRLAITLRFLASGDSMASLSYLFRAGLSTISEIISETTDTIWQKLHLIYMSPPNQNTWKENAVEFKKMWNFPNCIGAIDGKHVKIQAPPHTGSEFFNYKGYHSVVILAVVDAKYTFSLIDVGAQESKLRNSTFGKHMYRKTLNIPLPTNITLDGPPLPYVMVGDEAFPLLENLLKSYSYRDTLSVDKKNFNYRLSRARRISENGFGILVSRWRIYGHHMIGKLKNIDNIIKATMCLHNFIMRKYPNNFYIKPSLIDSEKNGPGQWRNYTTQLTPVARVGANTYTRNAGEIRDEYCRYFNEEGAISWQWDHI